MKEKYFWDLLIVLVFVGAGLYFQDARSTLHNQGCEQYWLQEKGVNASDPTVKLLNRSEMKYFNPRTGHVEREKTLKQFNYSKINLSQAGG